MRPILVVQPKILGSRLLFQLICLVGCLLLTAAPVVAQKNGLGLDNWPGAGGGDPVTFKATYTLQEGSNRGTLSIKATLDGNHYIHSTSQPDGGPIKTTIVVVSGAKAIGPFTPKKPPKITTDPIFPGINVEKHFVSVTWTAPITVENFQVDNPEKVEIELDGQVCDEACIPITKKLSAKFDGFVAVEKSADAYRHADSHVEWTAEFSEVKVKAGDKIDLKLNAKLYDKYHIYPFVPGESETENRTLLTFRQKSGLRLGEPSASSKPTSHVLIPGDPPVDYHEGDVSWTVPVQVPADAQPGIYMLEALVGYQTCSDVSCDFPLGVRLTGEIAVGDEFANEVSNKKLGITEIDFKEVAADPNLTSWIDGKAETYAAKPLSELLGYFCLAIVGGFVLNFMPCVLPVIGLKIMGFVQEGSGNPRRFVYLNSWFIIGILSVIMTLAVVTIVFRELGSNFAWGSQFGSFGFQVAMLVLVTAMALSFLGVWEIPIPGFATTKTSGDLMAKEGAIGAFFKGVLTTLLATPCSGPGLGAVFSLTITQPNWVILLVFFGVGLGLSLPYIVISFYPKAMSFLPKPGPWMETLKQVLAFPLLLTVVYFVSLFENDYRIAAMILVVVVWFGCWLIGRVPPYEEFSRKMLVWNSAIIIGLVGGFIAFTYFGAKEKIIDWQPYSAARLAELQAEGKTVMIDFTANWCPNCKYNLATAIETKKVASFLKENDIVPMLADYSQRTSPEGLEIGKKLAELQSPSIPLLAIYPAGKPTPIIMRDVVVESSVLKSLKEAGPSKSASKEKGEFTASDQAPPKVISTAATK